MAGGGSGGRPPVPGRQASNGSWPNQALQPTGGRPGSLAWGKRRRGGPRRLSWVVRRLRLLEGDRHKDRVTVDHLLTTTRTVRKRLDLSRPVEPGVIRECLEIAIQAPNGGNQNRYHFVVVTDPVKRAAIGAIYKEVFYQEHVQLSGAGDPGSPVYQKRSGNIHDSASYLADQGEVPVHIIPCVETRFENAGTFRQATRYGSILPAAWSLMLALRSRGLGTAWTTLHLCHEKEVATLLGIPDDVTQVVHLSVA
jgi:nitroreductase